MNKLVLLLLIVTFYTSAQTPIIKSNSLNYTVPALCSTLSYPKRYRNPTPSKEHKAIIEFASQNHSDLTLKQFEEAFAKIYYPYEHSTRALRYTRSLTPEKMLKALQGNIDKLPISRENQLERYKNKSAEVLRNVERGSCNRYYSTAYSVYKYDALLPHLSKLNALRNKEQTKKIELKKKQKIQKTIKEKEAKKVKAQKAEIKLTHTVELQALQTELSRYEQLIQDKEPKKHNVIISRKLPDGTMLGSIDGRGVYGIQDYTGTITQAGYYSLELQEHPDGDGLTRKLDNGFTETIKIYRVQTIGQMQFNHYMKSKEASNQLELIQELKSKIKVQKIKIKNLK